jgi:hypothetical protein
MNLTREITVRTLTHLKIAASALLLCATGHTFAAPFCAIFSHGKQCYYYDWDACRQAAGRQGACVINPDEAKAPSGDAPFCVVSSYATQCIYYDAQSCRQAAASQKTVCVVNPTAKNS